MMAVSAPMVVLVIGYCGEPGRCIRCRTLAVAGAGAARMALTLLLLCHPVEVHPVDFLLHVAAVVTIVLGTMGGLEVGCYVENKKRPSEVSFYCHD
jgi:molybdenum cofactor biosynthesis enzyme